MATAHRDSHAILETAGYDDRPRLLSRAACRLTCSACLARAATAVLDRSERSKVATQRHRHCANSRSCWGRSPTDRYAIRSDRQVVRTRSRSRRRAHARVHDRARGEFGTLSPIRFFDRHRSAMSSLGALHCWPPACAPGDPPGWDARANRSQSRAGASEARTAN